MLEYNHAKGRHQCGFEAIVLLKGFVVVVVVIIVVVVCHFCIPVPLIGSFVYFFVIVDFFGHYDKVLF